MPLKSKDAELPELIRVGPVRNHTALLLLLLFSEAEADLREADRLRGREVRRFRPAAEASSHDLELRSVIPHHHS